MKRSTKVITSAAAVLAIATAGCAFARDHGSDRDRKWPMHEAAIAACMNKTEGTNVSFDHPMWGKVNAVCTKSPRDGQLVAMSPKMVEHIKKSVAACAGKTEGDKVAIDDMRNPGKRVEATCKKHGDVLAAHPEHMGMGKGHHGMM